MPIGGTLTYQFDPAWIDIGPSRIATETTYVEFEGRTAYGEQSEIPFHVSSADWQESDRLFAGMLTAFGAPTRVIPIGGRGTFDGVMRNAFRRPRIEGEVRRRGDARLRRRVGDCRRRCRHREQLRRRQERRRHLRDRRPSAPTAASRSAIPRRDGGEQINARIRIERRPIADLRHAFGLDDYNLDGVFSGEFHVFGDYQRPFGFGAMTITDGVAYGERFESANAGVLLEGSGVRLDNIQIAKGSGRGTGAAFVGWNGTYSFNFEGAASRSRRWTRPAQSALPLSGLIDFTAGGSGRFDRPRYEARVTVRDLFVADEGIGRVFGDAGDRRRSADGQDGCGVRAPRGVGRRPHRDLTDAMDAELSFSVADTSLDPYIRAFQPRLSPYTTAVASGTIRVYGRACRHRSSCSSMRPSIGSMRGCSTTRCATRTPIRAGVSTATACA